ncbi:MAG: DnaA/Hda family protein [Ignavibacteriaceae bacterium]|nr:DnaA/Hda family protein [Ignavibacteriaceae bacterium]
MVRIYPGLLSKVGLTPLHRNMSFENFVINKRNKKVYEISKEYSSNPEGFLYLYGKPGCGKTHLTVSILKSLHPVRYPKNVLAEKERQLRDMIEYYEMIKGMKEEAERNREFFENGQWQFRPAKALFLKSFHYTTEISSYAGYEAKSKMDYINSLMNYDCIALDDFGMENFTDSVKHYFYMLIDEFYTGRKPMIITSNRSIVEINKIIPGIASRLAEGMIIHLDDIDHRINKERNQ